jgi:hypothetical protein
MLLTDVEDLKISVRSNHNRAEEVKAHAQLIRVGAD